MSYMWGASTHVGEVNDVQFISQLAKPLLIKWLGEYVGQLIFGAHTLNANVTLQLMISYEVMSYVNVLCSCMLNWIVGHLDCTFIVTQQWYLLEFDSKVTQCGLHPK